MKKLVCYLLVFSMVATLLMATPIGGAAAQPDTPIPDAFPSAYQTVLFDASFEGEIPNYVDKTIKEAFEGKISPTVEVLGNAFDGNVSTKYLTSSAADGSCYVQVKLVSPIRMTTYLIASANDAPERDPYKWEVYGSNNGSSWTKIDTQNGVLYEERFQSKVFTVATPGEYQYYKWVMLQTKASNPYLQYAELMLNPVNLTVADQPIVGGIYGDLNGVTAMKADLASGGIQGAGSLQVTANHPKNVKGDGSILLYDDLDIEINRNTTLSYCIKPVSASGYDTNYPGHYMAIDLVCTDGTRLSASQIQDQNGHLLTPYDQGATRSLVTDNWNYIQANLSALNGKTIDKVLISYDRKENTTGSSLTAMAHLDALCLYDQEPEEIVSKTQYVKTTRGSYFDNSNIYRGTAFPSVNVPNGMVKIAPATASGSNIIYRYPDTALTDFTITHQTSIHLLDYNRFQFMPNTTLQAANANAANLSAAARKASFSHQKEIDRADYYAVEFDEDSAASGVKTELTATDHAIVARITFPAGTPNHTVIFDSVGGGTTDNSSITFNNDGTFTATVKNGHDTLNTGYSEMYLYGRFSAIPQNTKALNNGTAAGAVTFDEGTHTVVLEIAQSYISQDQAKKNLELECPVKGDFDGTREACTAAWEEIFDIIDIEGASREQLIAVYSGLYRMYSYPTNYSENTGTKDSPNLQYRSPYSKTVKSGQLYTSNGFWDTYRTAWPAYSLFTPTKAGDLLDGILQHYKDGGQLNRWLNPASVSSMLGSNSDAILADAAVKGVVFDHQTAFDTIVQNAATIESPVSSTRPNSLSLYSGYVHSGLGTSVSWQIENTINDYAGARLAKLLGYDDYAAYLLNRSLGYTYIFEPESGFFISRAANGQFTATGKNVDPYLWDPNVYGHIETNAWGTAFTVAHDGEGLAALYGGKEGLAAKLDEMLAANNECTTAIGTQHEMFEGREVKMGQYWHSNQPAHATLYMYNYADQPYKTQRYTREVLDRLYVGSSFGQGYLGDEDNGEQSAWYILSALGFYPLSLGSGQYAITSPLFDKVTLHLESGDVEIVAHNNRAENVYIQNMSVDGVAYDSTEISHETLIHAKKIEFSMGNTPSAWGVEADSVKGSATLGCDPVPMEDLGGTSSANSLLFDNATNNSSYTRVTQPVVVRFPSPKTAKMVTVTGVDKSTAPSTITVQASDTGEDGSWVTLVTKNVTYRFTFQLMPLSLDNNTAYSYYRIQFNGPCDIGEIELLGYEDETYSLAQLTELKDVAKSLLTDPDILKDKAVLDAYSNSLRAVENGLVTDYNAGVFYSALKTALLAHISEEELSNTLSSLNAFSKWTDTKDAVYHLGVATADRSDPYFEHYRYIAQEFEAPAATIYGAKVALNLTGGTATVHTEVRSQVNGSALLTKEVAIKSQGDGVHWYTLDFGEGLEVTPGETYYLVYYLADKQAGNLCIAHGSILQPYEAKHPGYVWQMSSGQPVVFDAGQEFLMFAFEILTTHPDSPPMDPDREAAAAVDALIDAIPTPVTEDSREAIQTAKAAYDILTDAQKALVTGYDDLQAALKALADLEPPTPPTPTIPYGDVNKDGSIDAKDALLILQAAVKKVTLVKEQTTLADVNGDGSIDAKDALLVLQKAVDKIDKFPVEA